MFSRIDVVIMKYVPTKNEKIAQKTQKAVNLLFTEFAALYAINQKIKAEVISAIMMRVGIVLYISNPSRSKRISGV